MSSLRRDIQYTLVLKFLLLTLLWLVCFYKATKPTPDMKQWLLGSNQAVNEIKPLK